MTAPPPPALPAGDVALFLDIDGTLIEHQPHPEGVFVDDELRRLIITAVDRLDGAVAFVTGRSIEMVDRLFRPLFLPTCGLYGLEHRLERDGAVTYADEPDAVAAVADAMMHEFHTTEGVYFERKGPVLAVHTRAAPAALERVRGSAEKALSRLPEGYRVVAGHAGIEFLPIDALKSGAIKRLAGTPSFQGKRPVFIGDDVSDESGFEYVNAMGGLSIRVKPSGPTAATTSVSDVAAVRRWINDLLDLQVATAV